MKISVIICTFNGENYIYEQLNSIYSQDYLPNEVIICDDNSQDQTLSKIYTFVEKFPEIKTKIIKHKEQLGYIKNFEYALRQVTGDLIFFSDQDDIWEKNKIRFMLNYFEDGNYDLVFSNAYIYSDGKIGKKLLNHKVKFSSDQIDELNAGNSLDILLKYNVITGATMAIRKEMIKNVIPFSELMVHDAWIGLIASCIGKIHYINKPLIYYRQHTSNQIGVQSNLLKEVNVKKDKDNRLNGIRGFNALCKHLLRYEGSIDNTKIKKINEKISHFIVRENGKTIRGIPLLINELLKGRYKRYSNGMYSFAKDIFHILK